MTGLEPEDTIQVKKEEKKIVEDTEKAGGTVHEFNPDSTPQQKAATAAKSMPLGFDIKKIARGTALVTDMDDGVGTVAGLPPPETVKPERTTETGVVKPVTPVPPPKATLESKAGWREVGGLDEDEAEELHQDWLSSHLNDKYFGSWWHNAGIIFFTCFVCWVLGRFGAGFAWIVFILAISSTYYRTSIKRVRQRVRDDLNREQAKQRLETDFESTEWLNTFLLKFWVIYEPVLSATIVASVDQVLSSQTPAFLDSLRLSKFTLGTKPPRVDQVKTYPKSEEDIVLMDWRFSFIPNDVSDLTARQLKNKVNPKVVLAIRVGKGLVGKDLPVLVEDMSFSGLMRIKIKLMAQFPHVKTVDLSFLERPNFDYVLKPIGGETLGFDIGNIPGLSNFIREQVHSNLGPMMYAPNQFTLNIEQMLAGGNLDTAIGVLQVTIYTARGLKNPDKFSGTPDPYVVLSINAGKELARTEIQPSTTTPRWNETKTLLINSLNDALSFQIYDYNEIRKDKLLGTGNFDLKQLEEDAEQESVSTQIMYNAKPRGEVVFDVRFYPVLKPKKREDGTEEAPPETTSGIVAFTVHQAKDLDSKKSLVGALSPYAVFLLNGKEVYISKKLKRTNNPIWDEHVEILVQNRMNCRLGVLIKDDRDLSTDVVVGSYQIRLNDFLERMETGQDWFTLAGASTGKVRMEAKWKPVIMPGGLQGSGGYVTPIGVMRFHFKQAKDVRNVEAVTGGKSDPYVRIMVSNFEKARTVHINNDLNPAWDEVLYVPVHHVKEQYILEVMDHQSHSKDRTLGYTQISAGSLVQQNEAGEYVENDDRQIRIEPLRNDKKESKGFLHYTVSFIPCLNVADPEEEEENQKNKTKIEEIPDNVSKTSLPVQDSPKPPSRSNLSVPDSPKPASKTNGQEDGNMLRTNSIRSTHSNLSQAEKSHKSAASVTSVSEKKEPPKVHLTPEQLLSYKSGVAIFKIIEGDLATPNCYLEVLFDDFAFPSYVSSKARSRHQKWDEVGDGFVRELDFSRITLRLKAKTDESDVIASLTGDTADVLKMSLNNPHEYVLRSSSGEIYKIKVSMKYIPVEMVLDASESINNMGDLKVELVEAKNLPAADRSGYSDPYVVFHLNGEKVFKSKTVKKTLNPSFDEKFEVTIPSRTAAEFYFEVFDWDLGGSPDFLGKGVINLPELEPFQLKQVNVPMDGKSGEVKLKLLFRPAYITRTRRGTSTFGGGAGRVVTGLAGAPVKVVGGGVRGVGKGVGAAAGGIGGAASLIKRGFIRKKTMIPEGDEEEITPEDIEVAKAAVESGGGIKGTSDGVQIAVTGDNKETPLNVDPDQLTSTSNGNGGKGTPSRTSSNHAREMSIMSTKTASSSDTGLLQIAVVEGKGFPSGKDIKIILKTSQKEFYKSKAIKATEPTWNESYSLTVPVTQQIIVAAIDHHTFGSDKDLGEAAFTVEDHRTGDFWLDLAGGASVRLKVSYQEKKPGTPEKRISNSPFRRSKQ